mmetsp:Transcript_36033/g.44066  ORF Transcript_36033/g.44066 Transcript_36033/m.44066 type:complete len:218 (+) Transcript_36033:247-900(+)
MAPMGLDILSRTSRVRRPRVRNISYARSALPCPSKVCGASCTYGVRCKYLFLSSEDNVCSTFSNVIATWFRSGNELIISWCVKTFSATGDVPPFVIQRDLDSLKILVCRSMESKFILEMIPNSLSSRSVSTTIKSERSSSLMMFRSSSTCMTDGSVLTGAMMSRARMVSCFALGGASSSRKGIPLRDRMISYIPGLLKVAFPNSRAIIVTSITGVMK